MFIFNIVEKMSQRTPIHYTKVSSAAHPATIWLLLAPYNALGIRQALLSMASDFCNLFNHHYPLFVIDRIIVPWEAVKVSSYTAKLVQREILHHGEVRIKICAGLTK